MHQSLPRYRCDPPIAVFRARHLYQLPPELLLYEDVEDVDDTVLLGVSRWCVPQPLVRSPRPRRRRRVPAFHSLRSRFDDGNGAEARDNFSANHGAEPRGSATAVWTGEPFADGEVRCGYNDPGGAVQFSFAGLVTEGEPAYSLDVEEL